MAAILESEETDASAGLMKALAEMLRNLHSNAAGLVILGIMAPPYLTWYGEDHSRLAA